MRCRTWPAIASSMTCPNANTNWSAAANWNGGPDAFDVTQLDASLHADVRDGRLPEIEPGAGRVLGLLGIGQLRRRLTLDFSDFFSKGFAFDHLQGDIRLSQGSARTDNLFIKGPAADLNLRGSVNLRSQRFDQTVEVLPRSGGLLTAVGALAAGPAAGIWGPRPGPSGATATGSRSAPAPAPAA